LGKSAELTIRWMAQRHHYRGRYEAADLRSPAILAVAFS
jgi:hypothetical protein